ncbi:hypothetical protein [Parvibaculum sp.]|jgi:hypothetical protein|uniref:hypothetical protein n=1 Tax=Parvibaculum sp. TaxID=2024848 RepID=UPI000C8A9F21|nr:hypothetical protein [Parvibaculum sp.]MAB14604.1 hypothetical protein [Parvibaculum sp.]
MKSLRIPLAVTMLALPALGLTACANTEERQAQQRLEDRQNCKDLGFKEGTEEFGNCILKMREIRARKEMNDNPNFGFGLGVGIGL